MTHYKDMEVSTRSSASGPLWVYSSLGVPSISYLLNMLVVRSLFSLTGIEMIGVVVGEATNRGSLLLMPLPFAELPIFPPARVTVPRGKTIPLF